MPLTITDFIEQVEGVSTDDIPFDERERINDALADLTGGPGGTGAPVNNDAILVSKNLDGREGFNSIQTAISNAASGDTIFVEDGTYDENVLISNTAEGVSNDLSGLTITSLSGSTPEIAFAPNDAGANADSVSEVTSNSGANPTVGDLATVEIYEPDVTISGFDITRTAANNRGDQSGLNTQGLSIRESSATVEDVTITGNGLGDEGSNNNFGVFVSDEGAPTESVSLGADISGFETGLLVDDFYGNSVNDVALDAGSYGETVVSATGVDLTGPNDGTPGDEPRSTEATLGQLDIDASGVTVDGVEIAPETEFTPNDSRKAGVFINTGGTAFRNNIVSGVRGDAEPTGDSMSAQGIQIFKQTPSRISNITIEKNLIKDIDVAGGSSWPDYGGAVGVKIQNQLENVTIRGNSISDINSAGWTYGIVSSPSSRETVQPKGVLIEENTIKKVGNGAEYSVSDDQDEAPYPGTAVGLDTVSGNPESDPVADASEVTVESNDFVNTPVGVINKDQSSTLDATGNWWGDASGPSGEGSGSGAEVGPNVTFDPWSTQAGPNWNTDGST